MYLLQSVQAEQWLSRLFSSGRDFVAATPQRDVADKRLIANTFRSIESKAAKWYWAESSQSSTLYTTEFVLYGDLNI